jgi:membrane associated rhomboid family serine protease
MRSLLFVLLALLMTAWGTSFPSPQRLGALTMRPFGAASLNSSQKRVSASILHASRRPVSRGPVGGKKGKDRTVRIGGNRVALSATNILIGANIFTFLVTWLYPGMKMRWAKNDRAIRYYGQSYRFLTSLFVHGSAQHVLMNSYSLYNIGPAVEHAFGTLRFVLTYLAAGILANCATFATGSSPLSLGASGCTFGLIGALATYSYRNKAVLGPNADAMLSSLKQVRYFMAMGLCYHQFYFTHHHHHHQVLTSFSLNTYPSPDHAYQPAVRIQHAGHR